MSDMLAVSCQSSVVSKADNCELSTVDSSSNNVGAGGFHLAEEKHAADQHHDHGGGGSCQHKISYGATPII